MSTIIFQKKIKDFYFLTFDGKPIFETNFLTQVHGIKLVEAGSTASVCEADGFIIDNIKEIKQSYAILTADCVPVVLVGNKIIFLHAGWRGLHQGILAQKNVEAIFPKYIFIGPHIRSCCYEISSDFVNNFEDKSLFLKRYQNGQEKKYFDMEQFIIKQATTLFKNVQIESSGICTCCSKSFHSYRKNGTIYRNWNIISNEIKN